MPAIVLLHEQQIVFESEEEWTETTRFAVRLLAKNSQSHAAFSLTYLNGTDAVKHIAVCLLRPDGYIKDFEDADWMDVAMLDDKGIFSDRRVQTIQAEQHAQPGDVFACEVSIRRRQRHGETVWISSLDSGLPADLVQINLKTPKDFEGQIHCRDGGGKPIPEDEAHKGIQRWCWQNCPYEPPEAHAPSRPEHLIYIKLLRKSGSKSNSAATLADWPGVAQLAARYQDVACNSSENLTATAKQLTAGLASPIAKLEAIGRFVQQCPYAALDKNTGFGFGFQPRLASKVLSTRYGDCKDKVNLLRALLREVGVTAYPVAVSAEIPSAIDPGWPSLLQFNHVIAAIPVAADCVLPAVADVADVGRVLYFDPTSEQTPLGFLPWQLQNSYGLFCDSRGTGLVQLPRMAEDRRWRLYREAHLALTDSVLEGKVTFELEGEQAAGFRQACRERKESELRESLGRLFMRNARGLVLGNYQHSDDWTRDKATLNLQFRAREFGQKMPGGLWLMRLNLFDHIEIPAATDRERRRPYVVKPVAEDETIVLQWPAEYATETVPSDATIESEFGSYRSHFQVHDGSITCERSLSIKDAILAPTQYGAFRQFLLAVVKQDLRTLVLKKSEE